MDSRPLAKQSPSTPEKLDTPRVLWSAPKSPDAYERQWKCFTNLDLVNHNEPVPWRFGHPGLLGASLRKSVCGSLILCFARAAFHNSHALSNNIAKTE